MEDTLSQVLIHFSVHLLLSGHLSMSLDLDMKVRSSVLLLLHQWLPHNGKLSNTHTVSFKLPKSTALRAPLNGTPRMVMRGILKHTMASFIRTGTPVICHTVVAERCMSVQVDTGTCLSLCLFYQFWGMFELSFGRSFFGALFCHSGQGKNSLKGRIIKVCA